MFPSIRRLEGLSHPMIEAAYLKKNDLGNTLIIETGVDKKYFYKNKNHFDSFLIELGELVDEVEHESAPLDHVNIRVGAVKPEPELFIA